MFLDIAPSEFAVIAIFAILFIGPKDMPRALRSAGRWIGKMRRVSGHLRSGLETLIREAELEDMERKWKEQNAQIMAANPGSSFETTAEALSPPEAHEGLDAAARAAPLPLAAPAGTEGLAQELHAVDHVPPQAGYGEAYADTAARAFAPISPATAAEVAPAPHPAVIEPELPLSTPRQPLGQPLGPAS